MTRRLSGWLLGVSAVLLVLGLVASLRAEGSSELLTAKLVSHVRWTRAHQAEGQLLQQALQRWQQETEALTKERAGLEQAAGCSVNWNADPPACAAEDGTK